MPSVQQYLQKLKNSGKLHKGFVLSEEQRNLVKKAFTEENQVKIRKKTDLNLTNSVIKDKNGELFVLLEFSDEIPQGAQAVIKIAQNLTTGDFCLVKITRVSNLKDETFKKNEAEKETENLKKLPRMLMGYQHRVNPSKKHEYKHYNFIKILPGISLAEPENMKPYFRGEPIIQCQFALELLKKLDELKQYNLVHRDLNGDNVLVDPKTMEVNIIDLGLAISVDKNGFWVGPNTADMQGTRPMVRFANGADVYAIYNCFLPFQDETLKTIFQSLFDKAVAEKDQDGIPLKYNVVDLKPAIKEVIDYHTRLLNKMCPTQNNNLLR